MVENARGCDAQADRLRAAERRRMLEVLDRLCDEPVTRSRESVVAEIRDTPVPPRVISAPFRP